MTGNESNLLQAIQAHLESEGVSDSTFGVLVCKDGHLVKRIRDGKAIRRSTVKRVRDYLKTYAEPLA
mgnify:FL=1